MYLEIQEAKRPLGFAARFLEASLSPERSVVARQSPHQLLPNPLDGPLLLLMRISPSPFSTLEVAVFDIISSCSLPSPVSQR